MSALLRVLGSPRTLAMVWGVTLLVLLAGALVLAFLPVGEKAASTGESGSMARNSMPTETVEGLHELDTGGKPPISQPEETQGGKRQSPSGMAAVSPAGEAPPTGAEEEGRAPARNGGGQQARPAGAGRSAALRVAVAAAPDPDLLEPSPHGPLPVRAPDGRTPFQAYQRPFVGDPQTPRIAIIITQLGLSARRTKEAIAELPPDVSLAFSPYGRNLEDWGRQARQAGHEVLLMLPMEPLGYPDDDPGPLGLMTSLTPAENIDRLHRVLAKMTAYVGIVSEMGSRFTAMPTALRPVVADLAQRGLLVVDSRATARSLLADEARKAGLPVAVNDRTIDNIADPDEIDRYLDELETLALRRGYALGMGRPYPVTIARIKAWAQGLAARGFVLAPASAIARQGKEAQ
ncbi:MAG: divergent polysaccharide deacetylase family protein [Alphaproteobacteria bacterium]|nr:MAG: divergent polysaccharide deacetylase family protein [Alphaproteobacteria bacterium]